MFLIKRGYEGEKETQSHSLLTKKDIQGWSLILSTEKGDQN